MIMTKSYRISKLSKEEFRKFKKSVVILEYLGNSLDEITRVAKKALEIYHKDNSPDNLIMMNCVYVFLIIRTSAFYDELSPNFLKVKGLRKSRELISAIAHFRKLYRVYHIRLFRNLLAHNRRTVGRGKKRRNRPITDADISKLAGIKSHTEYESFSVACDRIIGAIKEL
jgi:hypothetical protein